MVRRRRVLGSLGLLHLHPNESMPDQGRRKQQFNRREAESDKPSRIFTGKIPCAAAIDAL